MPLLMHMMFDDRPGLCLQEGSAAREEQINKCVQFTLDLTDSPFSVVCKGVKVQRLYTPAAPWDHQSGEETTSSGSDDQELADETREL